MTDLTFQYPSWYLIFCGLLGVAYALILYFRNRHFQDQPDWLRYLLGTTRAICVASLAALLLTPLLKRITTEVKKPIVVFAQDNSESISKGLLDSAFYSNQIQDISTQLGEEYELHTYAFGAEVKESEDFDFTDKVSNFSSLLNQLYDRYSHQNLGAVIIASDGIYNEGSNPVYSSSKLNAPIYTIALGDTTPKKDLLIKRVFHNKIAYLGDQFSVQIDVSAVNAMGSSSILKIQKMDKGTFRTLQEIPININSNDFFRTEEVILDADPAGVQRFRMSLTGIQGESTKGNNVKDIFVDVLDARQKILILANAPHPDVTAIRQSLSDNKNYELEIAYAQDQNINVQAFDMVVLHQLPSRDHPLTNVMNILKAEKTPRLLILGNQSSLRRFQEIQPFVSIERGNQSSNLIQANMAPNFSLFTIGEKLRTELPRFAPLTAPFGEYSLSPGAEPLLYQKIGKIDTDYPLLAFGEKDGIKTGILCGEGIWKWRLFDFLQHENHDIYDELIDKTIQFLSVKEDKRQFRVSIPKNIFNENEPVVFDAELYNKSYERVNDPEVNLTITDDEGKNFDYVFSRTAESYSLDAGLLSVGNYRYRATTTTGGEQLSHTGQFSVQPIQLELYETTADHRLLRLLSDQFGGEIIFPDQIQEIPAKLLAKGTVKPVQYQTTSTKPAIHLKWLFWILLSLLTLEWVLRRYFGSY